MPGAIATVPKLRFTDSSGTPFVGGTLTIYAAGTTTPANTWQDRALTTLNTNPIELDGDGACVVWLDDALSYKIVLKNSAGVTQWTQDNIEGGDLGDAIELAAPAIQAATDQAEGFADDAEASRDAIDNRIYPGTAASDPTTRPDGNAIQDGDIYINTTLGAKQRVSGAWVVMTAASSADLANNSDAAKGAALVGLDRRVTTAKSVLDNMSFLEGKHNLRDFYSALYTYNTDVSPAASPTGLLGIAYWGDSVSPHVWAPLFSTMLCAFQQGARVQPAVINVPGHSGVTTTGTVFNSGAASVDTSVLDGTGGFADFTYLPGGDHYDMSNGATLTVDCGASNTGAATARAYLATGPGFGSALVELINRDTLAVIDSTTVDCSVGGSLSATKAQFNVTATVKHKIKITATGRVVFLRGGLVWAHGIVPMTFGRGSSTLAQQNYASTAIVSYLMTEFNVKLMFVECKEEDAAVNVPAMYTKFAALPACSKLVIGSAPDNSSATLLANNALFRQQALANDSAYFDAYYAGGSYAEMVRLGWMDDTTHPNQNANRFFANLILADLNLLAVFGTKVRRDVESASVVATTFKVPDGDASGNTVDVLVNAGGGAAGYAKLKNVDRITMGAEGSQAILRRRDSQSVAVYRSDNATLGTIYAGKVEQADANQTSSFAGLVTFAKVPQLPSFAVASLPGSADGTLAYATDGRKVGEGAGAGTGVIVYRSGATWRVFSTDAAVAV